MAAEDVLRDYADDLADPAAGQDDAEIREWLDSLDVVLKTQGPQRVSDVIRELQIRAQQNGVELPFTANTPYINSIPADKQPPYPGSRELERRIKSIIRWNAMSMVVRANRVSNGIGGHISTYASAATLYEVGFNHFFRAKNEDHEGDLIYFQGHASPGIYSRAFLEGRLSVEKLENFRRELKPGGGLSSYPHPWLMPDFWEFPTVSMGLGPLMAIYQARFNRYLEDRGLKNTSDSHVWAFLGDGECDEAETLGAITLAAREQLDNLIFVINCNLQRLDGPVRGNGKIIQELEAAFRGAGWNVLKVVWGSEWDSLLANDHNGDLVRRMSEVVDGQYQKYTVSSGKYIRDHFFGATEKLAKLTGNLSDEQIRRLNRGGHDPAKVYAAYKAAVEHRGSPTCILAKTVKGYGLGEAGEGKNITHQQKKLNEDELREFRTRFGIPISDEEVSKAPFYVPPKDGPEMRYLRERREALGGYVPQRKVVNIPFETPAEDLFAEFYKSTEDREVSTTMVFVRILSKLLREPSIAKNIVPIVPDEARTFGMEALFRQCGIYSHSGQKYEPVDSDSLLYYKEATDGQILEEGINEAGAMSSFIAAGCSHANHGVNMIPFFIYYSMFGFQRIGDLIWAAGDLRCRGFLLGGTAGRTTLAGEGLQHQDGHSHVLASTVPNIMSYDPAYAYELAIIIRDGIRRMYEDGEDIFYYITVGNENYVQPELPGAGMTGVDSTESVKNGILKGLYRLRPATLLQANLPADAPRAQLLGSGSILNEVVKAQEILAKQYGVAADVWSVTSYKELRRDGMECERFNLLNPAEPARVPYVTQALGEAPGVYVAASDYMKVLPDSISRWLPRPLSTLGTDGFGRSESREALRDFFEVDARYVVLATLAALAREGRISRDVPAAAVKTLGIDPNKPNPLTA